jgi:hypothetical protein
MHQYKTIVQTFLVLSILNLVYAAPVVPQEVRDTGYDVVVAAAEDVTTGSDRRRGTPPGGTTGTTPSQYSSSLPDGSPPHDSLPLDGSAPLQGPEPSSGAAPSSHLSAEPVSVHPLSADWPVPVPDSNTEASTSAHPLSPDWPVPMPDSNTEASTSSLRPVPAEDSTAEGSTNSHYTAITPDMLHRDPNKVSTGRQIAGIALVFGIPAALVLFATFYHNHHSSNSTGG